MLDFDGLLIGPCMAAFGETVTIANPGCLPDTVTGVFDEGYLPVLPLGDVGHEIGMPVMIADRRPVIGVQLSQFRCGLPEQDAVVTRTVAGCPRLYVVNAIEPDGKGWALLKLNEISA